MSTDYDSRASKLSKPPQRAPTADECSANTRVVVDEYVPGSAGAHRQEYVAAWYPQMGGYVGKCWIATHTCVGQDRPMPNDGFDVFVFHDGVFPFKDEASDDGRPPVVLHHCAPEQFIEFGNTVLKIQHGGGF